MKRHLPLRTPTLLMNMARRPGGNGLTKSLSRRCPGLRSKQGIRRFRASASIGFESQPRRLNLSEKCRVLETEI